CLLPARLLGDGAAGAVRDLARAQADPRPSVSWAAHDLEPYLFRAKTRARTSRVWCLIGSYSPDVLTKWAVYGFGFSHHDAILSDPAQFHRGWPGAACAHTPVSGFPVM